MWNTRGGKGGLTVVMKYNKEFTKPDGRKLVTGGPRDLQRKQKEIDRQQSELITYLQEEIRRLNKELATSGSGEYTGEQVDEEIRKAVSAAVVEVRNEHGSDVKELHSAVEAFKTNEKNLLEQIKNLEVYQFGIKDETDKIRLEKDRAVSEKKEIEKELEETRSGVGGLNEQLKDNRSKRIKAENTIKELEKQIETIIANAKERYVALEEELSRVEHERVLLVNEAIENNTKELREELEESQKQRANLQTKLGELAQKLKGQSELEGIEVELNKKHEAVITQLKEEHNKEREKLNTNLTSLAADKDQLNALHNKDMKKFQSEIEFLIKEKTDLVNKHGNEINKFKIEDEKKKGEIKALKERTKQKDTDEGITGLLEEQGRKIEALTEALSNAEQQLEIETNRPKMGRTFIDPLEKDAGSDLTPHIEIKDDKPAAEVGGMDAKMQRLRSLMGKLPSVNG